MFQYIRTPHGISTIISGKLYNIAENDRYFEDILAEIRSGSSEQRVLDFITRTRKLVEEAIKLSPVMTYKDGIITMNGVRLEGYAVNKLIAIVEQQDTASITPLANFLTKIQANPSAQVLEHLYSFLEKGNMPLTMSGDFLAYKAVNKDYFDIHSGKFDNHVGMYIAMPRNQVDDRRDRTCSYGFHVCSFDYLPHFSHADGHVMVCQVNPANVVAIPNDYADTKMRVSSYHVIDEVKGYYADKRNVLSDKELWNEEYTVQSSADGNWFFESDADDYTEAVDIADEVLEDNDAVRVLNSNEETVYFKKAQ